MNRDGILIVGGMFSIPTVAVAIAVFAGVDIQIGVWFMLIAAAGIGVALLLDIVRIIVAFTGGDLPFEEWLTRYTYYGAIPLGALGVMIFSNKPLFVVIPILAIISAYAVVSKSVDVINDLR